MFVAGFFTGGIPQQIILVQPKLGCKKAQYLMGNDLTR